VKYVTDVILYNEKLVPKHVKTVLCIVSVTNVDILMVWQVCS